MISQKRKPEVQPEKRIDKLLLASLLITVAGIITLSLTSGKEISYEEFIEKKTGEQVRIKGELSGIRAIKNGYSAVLNTECKIPVVGFNKQTPRIEGAVIITGMKEDYNGGPEIIIESIIPDNSSEILRKERKRSD